MWKKLRGWAGNCRIELVLCLCVGGWLWCGGVVFCWLFYFDGPFLEIYWNFSVNTKCSMFDDVDRRGGTEVDKKAALHV